MSELLKTHRLIAAAIGRLVGSGVVRTALATCLVHCCKASGLDRSQAIEDVWAAVEVAVEVPPATSPGPTLVLHGYYEGEGERMATNILVRCHMCSVTAPVDTVPHPKKPPELPSGWVSVPHPDPKLAGLIRIYLCSKCAKEKGYS